MAATLTLNGWPSAPGCISWSHDNTVAIGLKDTVTILVPDYRQPPDSPPGWQQVIIDAGKFADLEWPLHHPASWAAFSVGEELSEKEVLAVEWSLPGLGLFRRPILAVLTANSALSLWECTGKPEVRGDWRRILVVNHVLLEAFQGQAPVVNGRKESEQMYRRARRIQSFSWSKGLVGSQQPARAINDQPMDAHLMSLSDDTGLVTIVRIRSPHDLVSRETSTWTCERVSSFNVHDAEVSTNGVLECLVTPLPDTIVVAEQLSWSPWTLDSEGTPTSTLALSVNSKLRLKTVRMRHFNGRIHLTISDLGTHSSQALSGTIRTPLAWQAGDLFIALDGDLLMVSVCYGESATISTTKIRTGLSPWTHVSGMAINEATDSKTALLAITNYNQTDSVELLDIQELREAGNCTNIFPEASQQLQAAMWEVEKRQNMSDRILVKTHGAIVSPFGQFIGAFATFHPSEGLEYTIDARQDTTFAISLHPSSGVLEGAGSLQGAAFSRHSLALADSLMLSAIPRYRDILLNMDEDEPTRLPKFKLQILDNVKPAAAECVDPGIEDHSHSLETLSMRLRQQVVQKEIVTASRQQTLLEIIGSGSDFVANPNIRLLEILTSTICELPGDLSAGYAYSSAMRNIHATIHETLLSRKGASRDGPPIQPRASIAPETCELCGSGIFFESLRWSRCQKGHQNVRCALTFLSIQGVGHSKSCGICGIQFWNEYKMGALQHIKDDPETTNGKAELTEPLLRVVFTAFDVCIYCTGRYVC